MAGKIKLNHAGREYLHFPVTGLPAAFVEGMEMRFPPATTWVAMDWVVQDPATSLWSVWDGVTGLPTHVRVLIAGPDVGSVGGVVLPAGSSTLPEFRLINNPEAIIRTSQTAIVISSS